MRGRFTLVRSSTPYACDVSAVAACFHNESGKIRNGAAHFQRGQIQYDSVIIEKAGSFRESGFELAGDLRCVGGGGPERQQGEARAFDLQGRLGTGQNLRLTRLHGSEGFFAFGATDVLLR
jgi:hypothetical protein